MKPKVLEMKAENMSYSERTESSSQLQVDFCGQMLMQMICARIAIAIVVCFPPSKRQFKTPTLWRICRIHRGMEWMMASQKAGSSNILNSELAISSCECVRCVLACARVTRNVLK